MSTWLGTLLAVSLTSGVLVFSSEHSAPSRTFSRTLAKLRAKGGNVHTLRSGASAHIGCTKGGNVPNLRDVRYQWSRAGRKLKTVSSDGKLLLRKVNVSDTGHLRCQYSGTSFRNNSKVIKYVDHDVFVFAIPEVELVVRVEVSCSKGDEVAAIASRTACQIASACRITETRCASDGNLSTSVELMVPAHRKTPDCSPACTWRHQRRSLRARYVPFAKALSSLTATLPRTPEVRFRCQRVLVLSLLNGRTVCAPCTPGTHWQRGRCKACSLATYQNSAGAVKCIPCPVGRTTNSTGADDVELCLYIRYSASARMKTGSVPGKYAEGIIEVKETEPTEAPIESVDRDEETGATFRPKAETKKDTWRRFIVVSVIVFGIIVSFVIGAYISVREDGSDLVVEDVQRLLPVEFNAMSSSGSPRHSSDSWMTALKQRLTGSLPPASWSHRAPRETEERETR